jgi:hypothetical protein
MKKVSFKTGISILSATILVLFAFSCANPLQDSSLAATSSSASARTLSGGVEVFPLLAGQTIAAGTVSIWRDASKLYVKYDVNSTFDIDETHVWAGTDLSALPANNAGIPEPGHFASVKDDYAAGTKTATVSLNFQSAWEGQPLYIFAHAKLLYSSGSGDETGWAGDNTLDIARWNFYMHLVPPTYTPVTTVNYYTVSGHVFHDLDSDGVMDSGEAGLSGVTLTLSNGNTTVSGEGGSYTFTQLLAGTYTVSSGGLTGYFATPYDAPVTSLARTVPPSATDVDFGLSYESINSVVYYDANGNGAYEAGEPLLEGFNVSLNNGSPFSTDANGSYVFDHLMGNSAYTVSAADKEGFVHSSPASVSVVTPANSVPVTVYFGFRLDYSWIPGQLANGFTIGYWKTNLDKAIANKTAGTQVSKATLLGYVGQLSTFALYPLNVATMQAASDILSATGSTPKLLLSKQLMGSEFNYASGAFIGGNALVTRFFLYDGEYMLTNLGSFTSAQILAQKDRYDAYNNSHGGAVVF